MVHVSVTIDGKTYRMACDEGQEEHLRSLGQKLDSAIQTLKASFGDVGDHRLAIMAGIMIADELSETTARMRERDAEIEALKESRRTLIDRYQTTEETLGRAISEVSGRVKRITGKLNGTEPAARAHKPAAE